MQIIEQLPPDIAGTIKTKRSIFLDNWATYLPAAAGMASAMGPGNFILYSELPQKPRTVLWALFFWGGFSLILITLFFHVCNRKLLPNLILLNCARRQIMQRRDRIVDPEDQHTQFVQVMPRARWQNPTLQQSTDVGFLKIDREKGMLLFEGDKARYRIPAQSIFKCEQECSREYNEEVGFSGGQVRYWLRYFFVVVLLCRNLLISGASVSG